MIEIFGNQANAVIWPKEPSGFCLFIYLVYKLNICCIYFGLQRNTLNSKSNQCATAVLQHKR